MKIRKLLFLSVPILFVILAGKIYYDTNSIEVKHYQIHNSSLGEVLGSVKVAHLSDLHIKRIGVRENTISEILKKESPDLIFITGDSISFKGPYEPVMSFFGYLKATYGIYAVLGNTEYSNENGSCILCHLENSRTLKKESSPTFLRNSHISLNLGGKLINLIGLDDPVEKKDDFKAAIHGLDPKIPGILLAHSPEILEKADQAGIDFVLCGHNHGGQIFLIKYLRNILPLDRVLDLLEGFFQEGKTLMYVSRGAGTSYLPFRLGVKPEIAFFTFSNQPGHSRSSFNITNQPAKTSFAGFSFVEFFDIFDIFHLITNSFSTLRSALCSLLSTPGKEVASSGSLGRHGSTAAPHHSSTVLPSRDLRLATYGVLFDFESESDLKRLNWECHKWFERSPEHATSGQYSLKLTLPPGRYPGINFARVNSDWSKYRFLKIDVFNPSKKEFVFHVRIDDAQSGWEYADRLDRNFELRPGPNLISISTESIRTNINPRPLNLKRIERLIVFLLNNSQKRTIFVDNIRLE